jgi:hypothetical protein
LGEDRALQLASWSLKLEACFGGPQDVEWCLDRAGSLYVLQSRPLRIEPAPPRSCVISLNDIRNPVLLSGGEKAASGIGTGTVFILSADYLNINVRFGYHFVVMDTLCRLSPRENYISFRFGGGGADLEGRLLRASFLGRGLDAQGFETTLCKGTPLTRPFTRALPRNWNKN